MDVVVLDLGTFCDHSLVARAIDDIRRACTKRSMDLSLHHVTDAKNATRLVRPRKGERFLRTDYTTPPFLTGADGMRLADPNRSVIAWAVNHPVRALQARDFVRDLGAVVSALLTPRTVLVVAYPALSVLYAISPVAAEKVFVIDYAPAFPNVTVPWLFDSRIKAAAFRLYRTSPAYNLASHRAYVENLEKLASSPSSVVAVVRLACFDVDRTIEPAPDVRVVQCRPLLQLEHRGVDARFDARLGKRKLIYMTFGSYAKEPKLARAADALLDVLLRWCAAHDGVVVCADASVASTRLVLQGRDDYVPYSYVARRASLVVFTGSLCLQNACKAHDTPMLFVPFLTEQYFWAKNYRDSHDREYVATATSQHAYFPTLEDVERMIEAPRRHKAQRRRLLPTIGEAIILDMAPTK